jgi:hypothetical protein
VDLPIEVAHEFKRIADRLNLTFPQLLIKGTQALDPLNNLAEIIKDVERKT